MKNEKTRRKMDKLNNDDDHGPWDGKRYELMGLNERSQYILIDDEGVVITFPDNKFANKNYQATATALTRTISVCLRAGVNREIIKKQLRESSYQKGDTPDILLTAIEKFEKEKPEDEDEDKG